MPCCSFQDGIMHFMLVSLKLCKSLHVRLLQSLEITEQQDLMCCLLPSCLFTFCMYCSEDPVPSAIQELPSCAKQKAHLAHLEQINIANLILPEQEDKGTYLGCSFNYLHKPEIITTNSDQRIILND